MSDSVPSPAPAGRQIARAAGVVMITFVFSKLVSLLSNLLVARAFGTGPQVDAFWAANLVSDTIFSIVAGGALASAFVPNFVALLAQNRRAEAWRLASSIVNLVGLALAAICLLAGIFAPWVVSRLLASGFTDPAQQELAVRLLRIQLPAAVIFGLSGLCMGILNGHQVFLYPALAPVMYPLGLIFGAEVLAPHMGIEGLAYGVLIGAALHLLVQIPALLRLPQRRYTFGLGWKDPAVRQVFLLMAPRLLGVSVVYLNFWINTQIASTLPPGSITAIKFAFNLMMMPQAAIAQSAATAAMPTFSAQVALGRREEMRSALAATLRGVLLLALPATFGLILLRVPLVQLIYERGAFTPESTRLVAWALLWYAAGLVGHCGVEIASRAFYAMQDTRTPVLVTTAAMLLNVALSFGLTALFGRAGWLELGGLALANSFATGLECAVLLLIMRRRLQGLGGRALPSALAQAAAGTALMSAGLVGFLALFPSGPLWWTAAGGSLVGGGLFAAALLALRVPEAQWLVRAAARRIRRASS